MRFSPQTKGVQIIQAATISSSSFTSNIIDTKVLTEFDYITIDFCLANIAADMTVLEVRESDDSGMSGATVLDAFTGSELPTGAAGDNKNWRWNIQLSGGRKRYIDVVATVGGSTTAYCHGILGRAHETPFDALTSGAKFLHDVP